VRRDRLEAVASVRSWAVDFCWMVWRVREAREALGRVDREGSVMLLRL
jgi:hypothetical protein